MQFLESEIQQYNKLVWSTLLGFDIQPESGTFDFSSEDMITGSVQITGKWNGVITLYLPSTLARILHEKEVANPFQAYKIRLNVNSKKGTRRDRLYTHPTRFPRFQTS